MPQSGSPQPGTQPPAGKQKYVKAVGPRLRRVLAVVFGLFAVLFVNSVYLASVTVLEAATGNAYQNYFYQYMFLGHLLLGLGILLPVLIFGIFHMKNAHNRPNRRAVRVGYALFATSLLLLLTGVLLTRLEFFEIKDPRVRSVSYWIHVTAPLVVVWLFVLHRLAGRKIKWRVGLTWTAVAIVFALAMTILHSQDPRRWHEVGPASGEKYFFPSLARTGTGNFIPADTLMMDSYCLECHGDIYKGWDHSVHHISSFNNPAYLFSVRETRKASLERDGNVQASRFCAGCHDPVPFFSGAFDDPNFDDVSHPTSQAGITCTTCHAITHINSPRGNSDFTIEEPTHYPFAGSDSAVLRWVNRQLVKAKPEFHKKTFLKDFHKTAEFCSVCHKVHLPEQLNGYKFLRGQNHYDPYLLSGVSGHGVSSFYYPPKAKENCAVCHMPLQESDDFGARFFDEKEPTTLKVHNHQFPSANTAIPHLLGMPPWVNEAHAKFLEGVMRVDLFGLHEGGEIDGALSAPLRPEVPALRPGQRYLIDAVIRTLTMGHVFTQGTADSNEIWLEVTARAGERIIGKSGGRAADGEVDPWSHFVNAFVIDREGNRIDRRNAQDIFTALYSHQIPPGAADVVHYVLDVPADVTEAVTIDIALHYRKFDTTYMKHFQGEAFKGNDLPITTLATDRITFPIAGGEKPENAQSAIPPWQRWNDYGIGLLRKGETGASKGELRQAEFAFAQVEREGKADGPLNRARVYLKEGRLEEAATALEAAATHDPPAAPWSLGWFTAELDKQRGFLDAAIANYLGVLEMDTAETRERGFDFSKDYRLLIELGQTYFELAQQPGSGRAQLLAAARDQLEAALALDPENVSAHYNLAQVHAQLGDAERARQHQDLHATYKPDDNAQDQAIQAARRKYPAANHATEAVVLYDLGRAGAYGLGKDAK